ncbi:MAG: sugar transferase, partial [Deltaproteobacteria bacterium]|nr:sugar transferase [Deltaproteobacteria bacterium]
GWRGETETLDKMEKRVEFDLDYLRRWSLGFDLKIIWLTLWRGLTDSQAY